MKTQLVSIISLAIGGIIFTALACKSKKRSQGKKIIKNTVKTQLSSFGRVKQLEVKNGQFHCLITEGFKNEHPNISKCYGTACSLAGEKYTHVIKHEVKDNYFHLILKPQNA